jgi:hypothetical protein
VLGVSTRTSSFAWIARRRGNRVGPIDRSDLAAFRVIGVILSLVSLAATIYYGLDFDYASYTTFRGELRTVRGTVVAVEPTDRYEPGVMRIGSKSARRDETTQIVAVHYTFIDANKIEHRGVSYRPNAPAKIGSEVTIQHPVGRPDVSRIRGYRSAAYDTVPVALPIMAGAGVVLFGVGLFWRVGGRRYWQGAR